MRCENNRSQRSTQVLTEGQVGWFWNPTPSRKGAPPQKQWHDKNEMVLGLGIGCNKNNFRCFFEQNFFEHTIKKTAANHRKEILEGDYFQLSKNTWVSPSRASHYSKMSENQYIWSYSRNACRWLKFVHFTLNHSPQGPKSQHPRNNNMALILSSTILPLKPE